MERTSTAERDHGRQAPLRLYNSLTRQLGVFEAVKDNHVRVYTCGPTVYNYAHIGNLRAYIFADTLRRTLQWKGYDVTHVINITDVGHLTSDADTGEDKVELAARSAHRSAYEITENYTSAFFSDLGDLNVCPAAIYPRATRHIQEMIAFIRVLEQRGLTYSLEDGLYFDTSKVSDYGRLGALDLGGQQAGARTAADPGKRQPWDFSVWRLSPEYTRRLMEWDSPWGRGFPGWHLECSVMSLKYLGVPFDIHTGGVDHRQIHHPNEMAQNQGYLGTSDAGVNWWMHSEFLNMRDEKMSKSAGNFWRLSTLVDRGIHPLVYRFFLLQAHYRSQVEFTMDAMAAARVALERVVRRVQALIAETGADGRRVAAVAGEAKFTTGGSLEYLRDVYEDNLGEAAKMILRQFEEAMYGDLATPKALSVLSTLLTGSSATPLDTLRLIGSFDLVLGLGLLTLQPEALAIRPADAPLSNDEVQALVAERQDARSRRDWKRADEVRDRLTEAGVTVQDGDSAETTTWSWQVRED
jgi:cysteinyl-tRNA synthetase